MKVNPYRPTPLNKYGDPKGTRYAGGTPLFNESTGKRKPLTEHLHDKLERESGQDLNRFGDPEGTRYAGGTPLFDERTGRRSRLEDHLLDKLESRRQKSDTHSLISNLRRNFG